MTTSAVSRLEVEMNNKNEQSVTDALRRAFDLGQNYWLQATSVYTPDNRKADATRAKFQDLCERTENAIGTLRTQLAEAQKDAERWRYLRDSGDDIIYAMRFDVDGDTPISGAELDASIDAAKEEKNGA